MNTFKRVLAIGKQSFKFSFKNKQQELEETKNMIPSNTRKIRRYRENGKADNKDTVGGNP